MIRRAGRQLRRLFRWQTLLRLVLLVLTLTIGFATWLVSTESGAKVSIGWVSGLLPNFRVRHEAGTLIGPLVLRDIRIKGGTRLEVDQLRIDWKPSALFIGELHFVDLHARLVKIVLPPASGPRPKTAPTLPTINLPIDLRIDALQIDTLVQQRGNKETRYTGIAAGIDWQDTQLQVDHFVIGGPRWEAALAGTLQTAGHWPLDSTLKLIYPRNSTPSFTLDGNARGPLAGVTVALETRGLLASRIDGTLAPLVPGIPFTATLHAERAQIPPSAAPDRAATLDRLQLRGAGDLAGEFRLEGNTQLDTPWSEPVDARVRANGTWRGMDQLAIDFIDPRLDATLVMDYHWLDGQHFSGRLDVRRLDLALSNRKLKSRLAGSLQIRGEIPPAPKPGAHDPGPRFDIVIDSLTGPLLDRPMVISGPLRWQDAHWTFDDMKLQQGENLIVLRGTLADAWNADATLQLPNLHTLLPPFAGSATGSAKLSGPPADPRFALQLDARNVVLPTITLAAPLARPLHLPVADWSLTGIATLGDIDIQDAHTVNAPFTISAQGRVGWAETLDWDIETTFSDLALAELVDGIFYPQRSAAANSGADGLITGRLASRGRLGATLDRLRIDTHLEGRLSGEPLALNAVLDWQPGAMQLENLHLLHGKNRLDAEGALDAERVALSLDIDAPALENSLRDVAGRLQLQASITGPRRAPDADVTLDAAKLRWQDWALASLTGKLQLDDGALNASQLELRAGNIARATPGAAGPLRIEQLSLAASGTRDLHHIAFSGDSGPLAIALAADGGGAKGHWYGTLTRGSVDIRRWRWEAIGEPALHLQYAPTAKAASPARAAAPQLFVDPHCWSDGAARICLTAPATLGASGTVRLEAFHLPLEALLADLLPLDTVVEGRVGGMVTAQWQDGKLRALDADLRNGDPLVIALADDELDSRRQIAQIDRLGAQATLVDGAWNAQAALDGGESGRIHAFATAAPDGTLAGQLQVNALRVNLLEAFSYQVNRLAGTINSSLTLAGNLATPRVTGTLAVRDGGFAFTRLPLVVEQLDIDGNFDGDRLHIDSSFRTPESVEKAQLTGDFFLLNGTWGDQWRGEATLTGDRLLVGMPPEFQFTVSPQLRLVATPEEVAVTGDVRVPWGRIAMKKLPTQSVSLSRDVVRVHADYAAQEDGGLGIRQRVDINVLLGDDILFKAFGGAGQLVGNLRVRSTPELPLQVNGELHVKDGEYDAFGQKLKLRQATVIFNGPADRPLVEALAVREINEAGVHEVGVRLSGSLQTPESALWSSPELAPEETLSWLTTGQGLSDGPSNLRSEAAQTAVSLGLAQGSALLSAAGQEIGLRDVQLSSDGEGDDSEVQVGTHVSDSVYVGYNRRVFTGESSVMMRLKLTRRFMLEALSGVESAVDIFYTFEF